MDRDHRDFDFLNRIKSALTRKCGGDEGLSAALPGLVEGAVDYVLDPIRTARTKLSDLDSVEKTFIGLKIEHYLRDFLDFPKGIRDLDIDGIDLDVKNTVRNTWMIPPETFRNEEPCLLIMAATERGYCSLGLIVARDAYLNSPNRDGKRSIKSSAASDILWIVDKAPLPESRWSRIDMKRFRELRRMPGGSRRASAFFSENLNRVIHRTIIEGLLFDQKDYMKRIRGNQGARDLLAQHIAILSGIFRKDPISRFGLPPCGRDAFIATRYNREQEIVLRESGYFRGQPDP